MKTFWLSGKTPYHLQPAWLSLMFLRRHIWKAVWGFFLARASVPPSPRDLLKVAAVKDHGHRTDAGLYAVEEQKELPWVSEHWSDLKSWPLALYGLHMLQCSVETGGQSSLLPGGGFRDAAAFRRLLHGCSFQTAFSIHALRISLFVKKDTMHGGNGDFDGPFF